MNMQENKSHEIRIGQRKEMSVTGVREVLSFDSECVVLRSVCGTMTVEGSDLKVGAFDTDRGVVNFSGRIDSLYYSADNSEEKRGFFAKLFR